MVSRKKSRPLKKLFIDFTDTTQFRTRRKGLASLSNKQSCQRGEELNLEKMLSFTFWGKIFVCSHMRIQGMATVFHYQLGSIWSGMEQRAVE